MGVAYNVILLIIELIILFVYKREAIMYARYQARMKLHEHYQYGKYTEPYIPDKYSFSLRRFFLLLTGVIIFAGALVGAFFIPPLGIISLLGFGLIVAGCLPDDIIGGAPQNKVILKIKKTQSNLTREMFHEKTSLKPEINHGNISSNVKAASYKTKKRWYEFFCSSKNNSQIQPEMNNQSSQLESPRGNVIKRVL